MEVNNKMEKINETHSGSNKKTTLRRGAKKFLSAFLLASSVGSGLFFYHQHNKLAETNSKLDETTQELANTKTNLENSISQGKEVSYQLENKNYQLEQAITQGENNYDRLLREVVRKEIVSYPWHIQFEDDNFYAKMISKLVLGREPTAKEFEVIFDEVKNSENERYKAGGFRK